MSDPMSEELRRARLGRKANDLATWHESPAEQALRTRRDEQTSAEAARPTPAMLRVMRVQVQSAEHRQAHQREDERGRTPQEQLRAMPRDQQVRVLNEANRVREQALVEKLARMTPAELEAIRKQDEANKQDGGNKR